MFRTFLLTSVISAAVAFAPTTTSNLFEGKRKVALVNLIRFRQIYITIFFISARKVALYFLSPAAIARLSIN